MIVRAGSQEGLEKLSVSGHGRAAVLRAWTAAVACKR